MKSQKFVNQPFMPQLPCGYYNINLYIRNTKNLYYNYIRKDSYVKKCYRIS